MDPPDPSFKIENLEMWEKQLQFLQMVKAVLQWMWYMFYRSGEIVLFPVSLLIASKPHRITTSEVLPFSLGW